MTDAQPSAPPSNRRPIRTWIVVETVLGVPAVIVGAAMALMSVMIFDAPGSESYPPTIALFTSIVAFPIACVIGIAAAWIAIARHRDRGALWFSLMPVLPVVAGVIAMAWLQIANGGQFAP